jgi:hypothetical protein
LAHTTTLKKHTSTSSFHIARLKCNVSKHWHSFLTYLMALSIFLAYPWSRFKKEEAFDRRATRRTRPYQFRVLFFLFSRFASCGTLHLEYVMRLSLSVISYVFVFYFRYDIKFGQDVAPTKLCTQLLDRESAVVFSAAVEVHYWFD